MTVQNDQSETFKSYNHDPLCPNAELFQMEPTSICLYCHVIKKARNDENSVRVTALAQLTKAATERGYDAALLDVEQAAEQTYRSDIINPVMDIIEALRTPTATHGHEHQ